MNEGTSPTAELAKRLASSHRELLAFVEKRVRDRALAEDILHDAFVRSVEKNEVIRDDEAAIPWFRRVLRNAVTDHHRRRGSASRALEAFAAELELDAHDEAETVACRCITELAATLKPEHREALQRIEIDGTPVKQYAEEAGITSNNAAVRVFRAREALRRQVASACGSCAEHGCLDCSCDDRRASVPEAGTEVRASTPSTGCAKPSRSEEA